MTENKQVEKQALQKVQADEMPVLVGAEMMFEKLAEVTREIADRAYDLFRARGGEFGKEIDDWFRAESEVLRSVPVEITESKDEIFVSAAVPGYKREEIEISVKDNVLIISGTAKAKKETTDVETILREWNSNRFCRQLMLPADVDAEKVVAKLNNGMLEISLPKAATKEEPKVAIKAA